jgi:hypothetical protein
MSSYFAATSSLPWFVVVEILTWHSHTHAPRHYVIRVAAAMETGNAAVAVVATATAAATTEARAMMAVMATTTTRQQHNN